jgi:RES domain-containing protein
MLTVYRFAHHLYATDILGTGAKLYGGRWNNIGQPALYTSYTISLALVELFIHQPSYLSIKHNQLVEINIQSKDIHKVDVQKLKQGWKDDMEYCQFIGSQFLEHKDLLALQVPSAIIETEYNLVLNPMNKFFSKIVQINQIKNFQFDSRLFK